MPISLRVRATRMAISPRLAMSTFWNTAAQSIYLWGGTGQRQIVCVAVIELQSHSTVSDGQLVPAGVVEEAAKAGVTTLALTDHDAIAGVAEAAETAERVGIELVPAIEMSCVHEYAEDLHICGYWVDLEKIGPACERAQKERVNRAGEIVEKLRGEGFDLTLEDAIREAGDALSIGRPHIARAAGATGDLGPFFEEYLVPGAKAFVPRRWPNAAEAIELIRGAGGVAVIAHPYWDISAPEEVDDLIRSLGADGVETFYPTHSKEQTAHLLEICEELDLVPTGSSDYHGPTHKTFAAFGAYETYGLGEPQVPARPV
ncbi:MAG TPA: PHP domain-containing protein [Solirubrobacterales bacterium]